MPRRFPCSHRRRASASDDPQRFYATRSPASLARLFSNPEDPMSVTDRLSIQLYTLRTMEDVDRILDTVAEAGYRYVETVGSHLDNAAGIRSKLDARGLKASSSHVSL